MLKQNLPNFITLGNLASGCIGILLILTGKFELAPWCILVSAALDFMDGAVARLLNAHSAIGKDLDSLADMVSFGVLPGFLVWVLTREALTDTTYMTAENIWFSLFQYAFVMVPIFSAWRLAKFNNDPGQSVVFSGLPTPANALFWAGLSYGLNQGLFELLNQPWILFTLTVLMSILLVAPLPMFSFKFKYLKWAGNELRIIFLFICLPLMFWFGFAGLCPVILLYILVSALSSARFRQQQA